MLQAIMNGFGELLSLHVLIAMNIGVTIGIIFGSVPGINGNLAIILLLPFTFSMNSTSALIMLVAIYCGANFGGSISAILIKTPGTNAAAATLIDGYPLSQKGYPNKSLSMALIASTIGGIISSLSLLFFSPQIAKIAINFGPPEFFALGVFGLSIIASVSGESLVKGFLSGCIGLFLSTIGLDLLTGRQRFTFGNINMYRGIQMVPALLGVFAIATIISRINLNKNKYETQELEKNEEDKLHFSEIVKTIPIILKSSVIGTIIGAIPGTGAAIASYISYNEAKRTSKEPEKFGTGKLEGIAAPEAANNGVTAATLIPLLTLGIPGGAVAATLLGAFIMHGFVPGPTLFKEQSTTMYAIMLGILISNIFMLIQGKYFLKYFAKITKIPQDLLTTCLAIVCSAGAFAFANSIVDVYILVICGIVYYYLKILGFPPVPIVLGIVLGPIAEQNLRSSMVMSGGSFLIFLTRPISLLFVVLTVVFIYLFTKKLNSKKLKATSL